MAMQDKEYLEYLKNFTDTSFVSNRNFPNISPYVKDYDFVEGVLSGYDEKWVARIGRMHLYRELVLELKNNPESSYDICYEKEDLEGVCPAEFSAVLKRPNYWCEVDFDVFGSRVFNYFGVPTVFNRRFEAMSEELGFVRNYVASISFIKQDEEFFDLQDAFDFSPKFDVKNCLNKGLKSTVEEYGKNLETFLKRNHIPVDKRFIERSKRFMAYSINLRLCLLNDGDFRNGNTGIVVNQKLKTARVAPNHDFGELFDSDISKDDRRFEMLGEWQEMYPDDFFDFVDKTLNFVARENGRPSVCERLISRYIREMNIKEMVSSSIFENVKKISEKELRFGGVLLDA